jgi:hypothetical protein
MAPTRDAIALSHSSVKEIATPLARPCGEPEVSIVFPWLNEARTVESCIRKARQFLSQNRINGDNGSTVNPVRLAIRCRSPRRIPFDQRLGGPPFWVQSGLPAPGTSSLATQMTATTSPRRRRSSRNFVKDRVW